MSETEQTQLEDLSEEELKELAESLMDDDRISSGSSPKIKEKQDIMSFFNNVLDRTDTTKVSNLSDEELASVRLMQRAALYSLFVEYTMVARYIKQRAELILASGLSGKEKGGFFLKLINTTKKLLEASTNRGNAEGSKKGWFNRRNKQQ